MVHDPGKEEERNALTVSGGCTLSHRTVWKDNTCDNRNHMWKGGANDLITYPFREFLRKAGRGDWANLCGIVGVAHVGSTTLSKSFLRWSSTVSCGRYHAPRPDSLRTAHRSGMWPVRLVASCSISLMNASPLPNVAQARLSGEYLSGGKHWVVFLFELVVPAW